MKLRNPQYMVGTLVNGQAYIYTALGIFRSAEQAAERCGEKGTIIFEQFDVYANSFHPNPYGLTSYRSVAVCLGRKGLALV